MAYCNLLIGWCVLILCLGGLSVILFGLFVRLIKGILIYLHIKLEKSAKSPILYTLYVLLVRCLLMAIHYFYIIYSFDYLYFLMRLSEAISCTAIFLYFLYEFSIYTLDFIFRMRIQNCLLALNLIYIIIFSCVVLYVLIKQYSLSQDCSSPFYALLSFWNFVISLYVLYIGIRLLRVLKTIQNINQRKIKEFKVLLLFIVVGGLFNFLTDLFPLVQNRKECDSLYGSSIALNIFIFLSERMTGQFSILLICLLIFSVKKLSFTRQYSRRSSQNSSLLEGEEL